MNLSLKILFIFLFILLYSNSIGQNITIGSGENKEEITNINQSGFSINLIINSVDLIRVKNKKDVFYQASIPSFGSSLEIGSPRLPVYKRLIEIPKNSNYKVEVNKMHFRIIDLSDYQISSYLFPYQQSVEKREGARINFELNKSVYELDAFYSTPLYTIEELGEMRGTNIGRISISPIEYNPVKNQLKVYDLIEIKIVFNGSISDDYIINKTKYNTDYFQQNLINGMAYTPPPTLGVQYPFKYIIVADSIYKESLKPFINWKEKQGYKIIEAYTQDTIVGNTTTSIKNYLQSLYNAGTASDPAPIFVLFVGDVNQIPKYPGQVNTWAADLYYCEFTNDYFPEMMYGRFSANDTSELNPQIEKTIEYEKYLMTSKTHLDTSLLVSGYDPSHAPTYGDGQVNYGTSNYFNTTQGVNCKSYLYVNQSYNKAQEIRSSIDSGLAIANYTAHGSIVGWDNPRFYVSDVANMKNKGKYPFMIGNACLTNKFDNPVCLGEALLRARDKGAIGYIGASENTLWDEDYYWAVGFGNISANPNYTGTTVGLYDLMFHINGEARSQWALTAYDYIRAGNMAVTQGGSNVRRYWELYHLMGDPSLMPYLSVPTPLIVSFSPLLPLGTNYYEVTTEPFALVAISRNDSLIASIIADSNGVATLSFSPLSTPGPVDIVVSASQKQTYFGSTMAASPNGPYIIYYNHLIIDSTENNNGQADYGESIQLDMSLINITNFNAVNCQARLRTKDASVYISDSTASLGFFLGNDTIGFDTLFTVQIDSNVVDGHNVKFQLYVEDSVGDSWTTSFYIKLYAPNIQIGNAIVDDVQYGNGNGKLDPGETATLKVELSNTGSFIASIINSNISTLYQGVTINNSSFYTDTIKPGNTKYAEFDVNVDNSFSTGDIIRFDYDYSSKGYIGDKTFSQLIGQVDEDFETGDFSKFIWESINSNNWLIESSIVYEGLYSSRSDSINDNDTSGLSITLQVLSNDSISFYRKVSSEEDYDHFSFSIDGILQEKWNGEKPWERVSYAVSPGFHTFKWSYKKDVFYASNLDAAYLDMITFPPTDTWTSVENTEIDESTIQLLPNPAMDYSILKFDIGGDKTADILLYDSQGRIIKYLKQNVAINYGPQEIQIQTSDLSPGVYIVSIQTSNNSWFKKLVIIGN